MISSKRLKPTEVRRTIRLTLEDQRLIQELKAKTGAVSTSDILRNGLRKLAEHEGLNR